jgi:hypothetical protein
MSTDFPLGDTLYAGVPFLWERRVAPHPHTATAKDFTATIWWNWRIQGKDADSNPAPLYVWDSTLWLPKAPQNVVAWGVYAYTNPGSKKIQVQMVPRVAGWGPYTFTYGTFTVLPNPGKVIVAQQSAAFMAGINSMFSAASSQVNAATNPTRTAVTKWLQGLQGR